MKYQQNYLEGDNTDQKLTGVMEKKLLTTDYFTAPHRIQQS